jgi:hypothetical protein
MIIKSMSRKSLSFHQLVNYLDKECSVKRFSWNMYSRDFNKGVVKEFMENAKLLKNSRGKVYLYHEVISLENVSLDEKLSQEILFDLANKYVGERAKNHLVFGSIHRDTSHPHIHLIISANEMGENKRVRLSKSEFATIQANLEAYKNEKYKELEASHIYDKRKDRTKSKQSEQEIKHKRKKLPLKEQIKNDLSHIFSTATSHTYLQNALKNKGFELYQRGATVGVIFEGKKYRLKTLGMDSLYKNTFTKIAKVEARKERRSELKKEKNREKSKNHTRDFSR